MIEPVFQERRQALLRILWANAFQQTPPRSDETRGRGNGDPVVEGGEVSRVSAAARVARAGDPSRVYLRPREQIIQGADAVPNRIASEVIARQQALSADHGVFGSVSGFSKFRCFEISIPELRALTLPQRVPRECDITSPGQRNQHVLPVRIGFSPALVSQRKKYGGIRGLPVLGQIEI